MYARKTRLIDIVTVSRDKEAVRANVVLGPPIASTSTVPFSTGSPSIPHVDFTTQLLSTFAESFAISDFPNAIDKIDEATRTKCIIAIDNWTDWIQDRKEGLFPSAK
jgi:hypothetical protein